MRRPGKKRDEGGADAHDALLEAAADALADGRIEEALAKSEEALRGAPRSVPALHHRAAALADLGRLDEAREAYDRALAAGKDDPELLLGAADFHLNVLATAEDGEQDGQDGNEYDREDETRVRADEALERGLALATRGRKLARKRGDAGLAGELAWLEGVALNGLGRPTEALPRLADAEAALPDAVDVQLERASALYELCRFDEAAGVLRRAEALEPDEPWIQHMFGQLAERHGDEKEARRRFARARKLSPEEFPNPIALPRAVFDQAVEDALAAVPEPVRAYLSNVVITVEDLPEAHDLRASDPPLSPSILGLFRGSPYGQKASMDPWHHFPSSIVLYQRNLERFARDREELVQEIGVTLVHEVGHFLGLDEEELWARGLD